MAELNFHQLRIFFAVARLRSFSRAARELKISQPAVSSQVRQFEEDLGVVLIDRISRRVELTEAGRTVAEYAQRVFTISDEMLEALESLRDLSRGRLFIAASHTVGEYVLPPLLGRFRRTHPGIELKLEICPTRMVVDQVAQNEVDLGFVGEDVKARGIVVRPFGVDVLVLVASPTHPLAAGALSAEDLGILEYVMRQPGSAVRRAAERRLSELGIVPRVVLELSSNEAVKQAVIANLGVGVLSQLAVAREIEAGCLVQWQVPELDLHRTFNILVHRDKKLSGPERAFLDLVTQ
jgi:DNA-binding transcriptional LysR family regulator